MFQGIFVATVRALAPLLIVIVLGAVALAWLRSRRVGAPRGLSLPYTRRPGLFTQTEARFWRVLREAAPDLEVFGKVRLEDVVMVRRGLPWSELTAARNRIKSRHLDFVIVDGTSMRIVCAVELDDRSHDGPRARASDSMKERILAAAGVPLVRVRVEPSYDVADVARRIEAAATGVAPLTAAGAEDPSLRPQQRA